MKKNPLSVAAASLLALCLIPVGRVQAQDRTPDTAMSGIVVQGNGEVRVKPDIARLNLGVQTQAADSTVAAQENAAQTQKVIAAIKSAGVADKDIQTSNYSIYPQYDNRPVPQNSEPRQPRIVGYQVSNNVQVTVRKIGDVGKVIDGAVKAGANVAGGIAFDLDDPSNSKDEAMKKAVIDAKRKARVIAEAAGVNTSGMTLVSIIEGGVNFPRPLMEFAGPRMAAADAATPVQAGEQTVTATVTVRYRIGSAATP